jgi:hypothetical protein
LLSVPSYVIWIVFTPLLPVTGLLLLPALLCITLIGLVVWVMTTLISLPASFTGLLAGWFGAVALGRVLGSIVKMIATVGAGFGIGTHR